MIVISLVILLFLASSSHAAYLHVTPAELAVWQDRWVNGPYQSQWATIEARADGFVASAPTAWTARTSGGCWNHNGTDTTPGRTLDRELRDAGLMYLISGDTAYSDAVRARLLAQAAVAGTNAATNTSVWCSSNDFEERYFEIANWVRRLLYAYDYTYDTFSAGEKTTMDAWFLGWANHFDTTMNVLIGYRVSGRLSDNYTCTGGAAFCPGSSQGRTHFGGPEVFHFANGWNNILSTGAVAVGSIAIKINNTTLKNRAKRYFTEWLKYGVFPTANGAIPIDQTRWNGALPQTAYLYVGTTMGSMIVLADHFARAGDPSLYDMTTEEGVYNSAAPGNAKSLIKVMRHFADLTLANKLQYASTTSTTDPTRLIDQNGNGENHIEFIYLAAGNLYYKDATVKSAYETTIVSPYFSGGYDHLGGDWGSYPMILAMFGDMENNAANPFAVGGGGTGGGSGLSGITTLSGSVVLQ